MKVKMQWRGNASQQKAMRDEINRQIIEADRKFALDFDAMVLYTLHLHLGFGKKRLYRFYKAFIEQHEELIKYYEMPDDYAWLCRHKLKEIGVDIEAWNKEAEATTQ